MLFFMHHTKSPSVAFAQSLCSIQQNIISAIVRKVLENKVVILGHKVYTYEMSSNKTTSFVL